MVAKPGWLVEEATGLAAIFPPEGPYAIAADTAAQSLALPQGMFVGEVNPADFDWVVQQNRKMNDADAATLLLNHAFRDWRDVLPHVDVPTLVIAAEASVFPSAGAQWLATQIPCARAENFKSDEG